MRQVVDVQRTRVVEVDETKAPGQRHYAEVLVIGGGLGGVAAAMAACAAGRTVCLVEETAWIGGQATSQGVSALDENNFIETTCGTRAYHAFRTGIRDWYRRNAKLKPAAAGNSRLNPGNAWVSRVCFEPRVGLKVLEEQLGGLCGGGHLRPLTRCKAYNVARAGDRIESVDVVNLDSGETLRLSAAYVIDATELGDLLALGGAAFVTGAESKVQTGEPGAAETADPEDVQSFTYPFVIERRPGEKHAIERPANYESNRREQPYTLVVHYRDRGDILYGMFERRDKTPGSFWTYRRLIDAGQFDDPKYPNDLAMINWPGNDYRFGNLLVEDVQEQVRSLREGKALSLGFLYWLQHEVDRDDGTGKGYPEFKLRADVMGTEDGLSMFPYIRESRRLVAVKTILEQEVTTEGVRAAHFADSVGIGLYGIDLHESKRNRKQVIGQAKPFQIPLGALIPKTTMNLLAGNKNIGTTHITNGCYRLHPVEWAVGEAAGETAALCIERGATPLQVRETPELMLTLQRRLVRRGCPIFWYDDVPVAETPRFEKAQMLPFERPEVLEKLKGDLHGPKL